MRRIMSLGSEKEIDQRLLFLSLRVYLVGEVKIVGDKLQWKVQYDSNNNGRDGNDNWL